MGNLTDAQKIYLGVLLLFAGAWLGLELGVPVYEYAYGKSALTALLAHLASIMQFALFGVVALAFVLQRIGILPTIQSDPGFDASMERAMPSTGHLRNLAIWIVIALVVVFLFNLFQGTGGKRTPDLAQISSPDLMSIFINWFPMLLIFGVWVFFLRQMRGRQGRNTDKPNDQ